MTDLRDQLPARVRNTCHPSRPHFARRLCAGCYEVHRRRGTLADHPRVKRLAADFVEDYTLLRSLGLGRSAIAARMGMTRNAVDVAYSKAIRRGALTPDRRPS